MKDKSRSDSKGVSFTQFFARHSKKVNVKPRVSNTLSTIAEEDLRRIAVLNQKWLKSDEKQKANLLMAKKNKKQF